MSSSVHRQAVDLSAYPDLVVIYLGMRVKALRGIKTVLGLGPQIEAAGNTKPDGLLRCEQNIVYSLFPFHIGMRWYWRDFESMEAWTRSEPHRKWWKDFMKDAGGTSFWHETYCMRGGIEAIYAVLDRPLGLTAFAPVVPAQAQAFSARRRLKLHGDGPAQPEGMSESEIRASA